MVQFIFDVNRAPSFLTTPNHLLTIPASEYAALARRGSMEAT